MLAVALPPMEYLWLVPLGFVVGALGTLIGAGGGFILAPVLFLLFPSEQAVVISSISLAVVFLNATSGSIAYGRMKRIHYPSGLLFAAAGLPGAVLGAMVVAYISRGLFARLLGSLLAVIAVYLLLHRHREPAGKKAIVGRTPEEECLAESLEKPAEAAAPEPQAGEAGATAGPRIPRYNKPFASAVSFLVGCVSSLLGIGGGIIHVPFLVKVLKFPAHNATATSHFVLAILACAGTLMHVFSGDFHTGVWRTVLLGVGVLVGAQVGAALSTRVHAKWIIRCLAVALLSVGIRMLWAG